MSAEEIAGALGDIAGAYKVHGLRLDVATDWQGGTELLLALGAYPA